MGALNIIAAWNGILRLGSKWRVLQFSCEENQTYVGQINEPAATSFTITEGSENFTIDDTGLIEFKVAPDYERRMNIR